MAATTEQLGELHHAVAKELVLVVASQNATVEELSTAVTFLKNNGIKRKATKGSAMERLAQAVTRSWDRLR